MLLRLIAVPVSLALLLLMLGCRRDPHINSFRVAPQNACPGEVVMATWETTSDFVQLSLSSGDGDLRNTANGFFGHSVDVDTVFRLSAHIEDRSITETRRVTVASPLHFPEVITPRCDGSTPRFPTIIFDAAQYSNRFKVNSITVSNRSPAPVTVQHLSINRVLRPGETVTETDFGTIDFIGEWLFSTPLPPNACQQQTTGGGQPPPALPSFEVQLVAACR